MADTEIVTPGARVPSHRVMCSSDRKRFIVLHVNAMLSHHWLAGTRQWKRSESSLGRCSTTRTGSGSAQSGHDVSTRPSAPRAAQIPKASHAQLAYHHRSSAYTRWAVGTAENGFNIRNSSVDRSRTRACWSWSRRHTATMSSPVSPQSDAVSAAVGARPNATNWWYVTFLIATSASSTSRT